MKVLTSIVIFMVSLEVILRLWPLDNYERRLETILEGTKMLSSQDYESMSATQKFEYAVRRDLTFNSFQPKVPHPFFGYVYNRALDYRVNRDGFLDELDFQSINRSDSSKLYIGVFGGSVAKGFVLFEKTNSRDEESFIAKLRERLPSHFAGKQIHLLNFAVSAFKQPQQFLVSAFFSDKIHMAINIDGFNEIMGDRSQYFPIDYPNYSNLFYSLNPARNNYLSSLYSLHQERVDNAQVFQSSLLSRLAVTKAVWTLYDRLIERQLRKAHVQFIDQVDEKFPYYEEDYPENDVTIQRLRAENWQRYSRLQHAALESQGIPFFHFLQPNQHVVGSKPLSDKELRLYYDTQQATFIDLGYQELRTQTHRLAMSRYPIYDLTKVFIKTKETVYNDSCCHLNRVGYKILQEAILEVVVRELSRSSPNTDH